MSYTRNRLHHLQPLHGMKIEEGFLHLQQHLLKFHGSQDNLAAQSYKIRYHQHPSIPAPVQNEKESRLTSTQIHPLRIQTCSPNLTSITTPSPAAQHAGSADPGESSNLQSLHSGGQVHEDCSSSELCNQSLDHHKSINSYRSRYYQHTYLSCNVFEQPGSNTDQQLDSSARNLEFSASKIQPYHRYITGT